MGYNQERATLTPEQKARAVIVYRKVRENRLKSKYGISTARVIQKVGTMKTKQIVLYDEQAEACKKYFEKAKKDADRGVPGAVIAQVIHFNSGRVILQVGYVSHEQMLAIAQIMGHAPVDKIGTP